MSKITLLNFEPVLSSITAVINSPFFYRLYPCLKLELGYTYKN